MIYDVFFFNVQSFHTGPGDKWISDSGIQRCGQYFTEGEALQKAYELSKAFTKRTFFVRSRSADIKKGATISCEYACIATLHKGYDYVPFALLDTQTTI